MLRTRARLAAGAALLAGIMMAGSAWTGQASAGATQANAVTIIRDEHGVPHVYGNSLRSLFYGVGYAAVQDRLWQADVNRHFTSGRLVELFGPGDADANVQSDIFMRKIIGDPARVQAVVAALDPDTRTMMQAMVDGMNAWISDAQRTGHLAAEYAAFGLTPEPFTIEDQVRDFMIVVSSFVGVGQGQDELNNQAQLTALVTQLGSDAGQRAFADTHWLDDPSAPTTIPPDTFIRAAAVVNEPFGSAELSTRHRSRRRPTAKHAG